MELLRRPSELAARENALEDGRVCVCVSLLSLAVVTCFTQVYLEESPINPVKAALLPLGAPGRRAYLRIVGRVVMSSRWCGQALGAYRPLLSFVCAVVGGCFGHPLWRLGRGGEIFLVGEDVRE